MISTYYHSELNGLGFKRNKEDLSEVLSLLWTWDESTEDNISLPQNFMYQNPSSFDTKDIIEVLKERRKRKLNNLVERDKVNMNSWQTDVDSRKKNLNMLEEEVTELEHKIHETDSKLSRHGRQYNRDTDRFDRAISKLTMDHENTAEEVAYIEGDVASLQSRLTAVTRQLTRVDEKMNEVDSLTTKVRGNELKIHNLTDFSQKKFDNAINKMKVSEANMVSKGQIHALQQDLSTMRDNMLKTDRRFDNIETALDHIRSQRDSIVERDTVAAESLQGLARQFDSLQESVVELGISQLKSSTVEQDLDSVRENMSNLQAKAQSVETSSRERFNKISQDIFDLEQKLQASVEDHETVKANDNNEHDLVRLEETVIGIVARVDQLVDLSTPAEHSSPGANDINRLEKQISDLEKKLQASFDEPKTANANDLARLEETVVGIVARMDQIEEVPTLAEYLSSAANDTNRLEKHISELEQKIKSLESNKGLQSEDEVANFDWATKEELQRAVQSLESDLSSNLEVIQTSLREDIAEMSHKIDAAENLQGIKDQYENVESLIEKTQGSMKALEEKVESFASELTSTIGNGSSTSTDPTLWGVEITEFKTTVAELADTDRAIQQRFDDLTTRMENLETSPPVNKDYVQAEVSKSENTSLDVIQELERSLQEKLTNHEQLHKQLVDEISQLPTTEGLRESMQTQMDDLMNAIEESQSYLQLQQNDMLEKLKQFDDRVTNAATNEYVQEYGQKVQEEIMSDLTLANNSLRDSLENLQQNHENLAREVTEKPSLGKLEERISNRLEEMTNTVTDIERTFQAKIDKSNVKLDEALQQSPSFENLEELEQKIRDEVSQKIDTVEDSNGKDLTNGLSILEEKLKTLQDLHSEASSRKDLEDLSTRIEHDLQNAMKSNEAVQEAVNGISSELNGLGEQVDLLRNAQAELPNKGDLDDLSEKIMQDVHVEDSIAQERLEAFNIQFNTVQQDVADIIKGQDKVATKENLQKVLSRAQEQTQQAVNGAKLDFNKNIELLRDEQSKSGEKLPEIEKRVESLEAGTRESIELVFANVESAMNEIEKIQGQLGKASELPTKQFVMDHIGQVEESLKQSFVSVENNLQESIGSVKNDYDGIVAEFEKFSSLSTSEITSLRNEINDLHSNNAKTSSDLAGFEETFNLMNDDMISVSQKADMWQRLSKEMLNQVDETVRKLQNDFADFQEIVPGEKDIQKSIDDTLNEVMLQSEAAMTAKAEEAIKATQNLRVLIEESKARMDKIDTETTNNFQALQDKLLLHEGSFTKTEVI